MSELTDARKQAKLEREILKFERNLVALQRIYEYILTHPDYDLRKKLPKEIRTEVAGIQEILFERLSKLRLEHAEIGWKYEEQTDATE